MADTISETPQPRHEPPPQNRQDESVIAWMRMVEKRLDLLESQAGTH